VNNRRTSLFTQL